jgi:hypothetical protein
VAGGVPKLELGWLGCSQCGVPGAGDSTGLRWAATCSYVCSSGCSIIPKPMLPEENDAMAVDGRDDDAGDAE